jgi:hypothetical protein
MSVTFWTVGNLPITEYFDSFKFQTIVLFDRPVQLDMLDINIQIYDKKSYTLTLYTENFQIHIDRKYIYITNHEFITDKDIILNDDSIKINLYDRTFIKGILEQINPKLYITNKILPKKKYYNSININRRNLNPYENPFNKKVVPFNNAFDNSKSVYHDPKLEALLRQCDINYTDEKQHHKDTKNSYEKYIQDCERNLKEYKESENTCKTQNNELQSENEKFKKQNKYKLYLENEELKKQIESNNREINYLKSFISTHKTNITVFISMWALLLGLFIFLFFLTINKHKK